MSDNDLPPDRATWRFGDLLKWHLFDYGTRPNGDPRATAGRIWELAEFCSAVRKDERTVRNWIRCTNTADNLSRIETALFGDSGLFDDEREELRRAHARASRRKKKGLFGRLTDAVTGNTDPASEAGEDEEREARNDTAPSDDENAGRKPQTRTGALVALARTRIAQAGRRGIKPVPAQSWYTWIGGNPPPRTPRAAVFGSVAAFVLIVGAYVWSRPTSQPPQTSNKQEAKVAPAAPRPPPVLTEPPAPTPAPSKPAPIDADAKKTETPKPPAPAPKVVAPALTPEQQRAAKEERVAQQTVAALIEAHNKEVRAREEEAIRRDAEAAAAKKAQDERDGYARQIAGMGYSVLENTALNGHSIGLKLTETITECGLACLRDSCDGFAFTKKATGPKVHTCYRYKAPLTLTTSDEFTSGRRTAETASKPAADSAAAPSITPGSAATTSTAATPLSETAEADPPADPKPDPDGLTHCANGPFKVTGFTLSCESLIGGGASPGASRERYVVPNINACAAWCRKASRCAGFAYHAAQPGDQHDCQILGRGFGTNHGEGWVSGIR